uniref:E3 ubiquitin-protein ligase makorin-2 n=1 Tax=Pipistrellus kuhlii TaxID=59472 RepID=A0A7J7WDG7_PIPKU|nr:makorin ring finger protein 2 [Pipistrellus kuhlii]
MVCVGKETNACSHMTWQTASHPPSASTIRRATVPMELDADMITQGPLLQLVVLWAPCPTVCPPQASTVLTLLPTSLCPYAAAGECRFGDACVYLHGEMCEICRLQVLHPFDPEQRKAHEKICMSTFEHEMEKAFAFQASQDKVCSVCMEVILEKASASERRFGILSNCNHTYCLSCIRQWRCAKQFENTIIKSCPECRVISEFVIPSVYWVEDQNKKNELIEAFKQGMGKKACKYFDQGKGTCPFGNKCLYRHAYPDGRLAEPEKPRKQLSSEGTVRFFNSVRLWDFIENRESQQVPGTEDADMTELGDLFMHLSGAESSEP